MLLDDVTLDDVTSPVYSDERVTPASVGFNQDLILSAGHLYALTAHQVFVSDLS